MKYSHSDMLGRMKLRDKMRAAEQAGRDSAKIKKMLKVQQQVKKSLHADVNFDRDDLIEAIMAHILEGELNPRDYRAAVRKAMAKRKNKTQTVQKMKERNRALQDFLKDSGTKAADLKHLR